MAKASRTKAINDLYNFIFSLKDKCDSINDINKDLIMQYSRFTVLASEMSRDIQDGLGKLDDKRWAAGLPCTRSSTRFRSGCTRR